MPKKDISYWALYLKKYLTDENDPRKDDDSFIDARAEMAAATMEEDTFCRFQVGKQQRMPQMSMDDNTKQIPVTIEAAGIPI